MSDGKPRGRSPEAKARRAATVRRVIEHEKQQAERRLCVRCGDRAAAPNRELCRACRYYTRDNPDWRTVYPMPEDRL